MRAVLVGLLLSLSLAALFADVLVGNGRVVTERRSLSSFTSISLSGTGILRVHRGAERVELSSDSNILPYITTSVSGGELSIGLEPLTGILSSTKLQYDISLPELAGLRISGSGDAYVDAFRGEAFSAIVSGSGGIKAELDYKSVDLNCSGSGGFDAAVKAASLELRCSGSGDAFLRGSADRGGITISGSGTLGGRDLAVGEARISISGSGKAELRVARKLEAVISGSGGIKYWGRPQVSQTIRGSGRVSQAGD